MLALHVAFPLFWEGPSSSPYKTPWNSSTKEDTVFKALACCGLFAWQSNKSYFFSFTQNPVSVFLFAISGQRLSFGNKHQGKHSPCSSCCWDNWTTHTKEDTVHCLRHPQNLTKTPKFPHQGCPRLRRQDTNQAWEVSAHFSSLFLPLLTSPFSSPTPSRS